jgi:hypothetical protein
MHKTCALQSIPPEFITLGSSFETTSYTIGSTSKPSSTASDD